MYCYDHCHMFDLKFESLNLIRVWVRSVKAVKKINIKFHSWNIQNEIESTNSNRTQSSKRAKVNFLWSSSSSLTSSYEQCCHRHNIYSTCVSLKTSNEDNANKEKLFAQRDMQRNCIIVASDEWVILKVNIII